MDCLFYNYLLLRLPLFLHFCLLCVPLQLLVLPIGDACVEGLAPGDVGVEPVAPVKTIRAPLLVLTFGYG